MSANTTIQGRIIRGHSTIVSAARVLQVPVDLTVAQSFQTFNEHADDANTLQAVYASSSIGDWKGRSFMNLIDLRTPVGDLVSLFNFRRIEYVIAAPEAAPAPLPVRSAFDALMNQPVDYLPPSIDAPTTGNIKVRNDLLSYLRKEQAFFQRDERTLAKSTVDTLEMVFWNLDGQAAKFAQASNVPALPDSLIFPCYRIITHVQGKKKGIPNLDTQTVAKLSALLINILQNRLFKRHSWSKVQKDLDDLLTCLTAYDLYLKDRNRASLSNHSSLAPIREVHSNLQVRIVEAVKKRATRYDAIHDALVNKPLYSAVDVRQYAPKPPVARYNYVKTIALTYAIRLFTHDYGNQSGKATFAWRLPDASEREESECTREQARIVQKILPEYHTRAMRASIVDAFKSVKKVRAGHIVALYQELTGDVAAVPTKKCYFEDLTKAIDAGLPIDQVTAAVEGNSAHRNGKYDQFFAEAKRLLHEVAGPHERRHGHVLYLTQALSCRDLIEQVSASMTNKKIEHSCPSIEWLRLQFCPSNPFASASSGFSSALGVSYKLQSRQLTKGTPDSHYATAQYRSFKEWCVKHRQYVLHLCLDDKSTIPVSDPQCPVSAVPRQRPVITPKDITPSVSDHDFVRFQLTPSVSLNVPVPDKPDAVDFYQGQVRVILKNQLFEPSSAMRHAAEVFKNLNDVDRRRPIMTLYTDGGPDHRTNFITVIIADLALFLMLNSDMLVHMPTPPGLS
jgi:hypothetical protein